VLGVGTEFPDFTALKFLVNNIDTGSLQSFDVAT
jgi:hypothetical protein